MGILICVNFPLLYVLTVVAGNRAPAGGARVREGVAVGEETDFLDAQGDAYAYLAEVLLLAGKTDEAASALKHALERYERKGNVVSAQRVQTRMAELHESASR